MSPLVFTLALPIGAGLAWGAADFLAGVATRRFALLAVLAITQGTGLVLALGAVALYGEGMPSGTILAIAAASGIADLVGVWALYRGLAVGAMGLVAPIAGTAAIIPVGAGLIAGERPSTAALIGIFLVVGGVVVNDRVASKNEEASEDGGQTASTRRGMVLGLIAALGFGLGFVGLDIASESGEAWATLANRGAAFVVPVALLLAIGHDRPAPGARNLPGLLLVGALDLAAIGLFAMASTRGMVGVAAALASLYPVVTALLARRVLSERLPTAQLVAMACAMAGVAAIAAG